MSAASAPAAAACSVARKVRVVELEPVPAMIGTRPLTVSTVSSITRSCSSSEREGDSPVVPQGTMPCVPPSIWNSISSLSLASSRDSSFLNGVTSATKDPSNIFLPPYNQGGALVSEFYKLLRFFSIRSQMNRRSNLAYFNPS